MERTLQCLTCPVASSLATRVELAREFVEKYVQVLEYLVTDARSKEAFDDQIKKAKRWLNS